MAPINLNKRVIWGLIAILILAGVDFVLWTWPWAYTVAVSEISTRRSMANAAATYIPLEIVRGEYRPLPRATELDQIPDLAAAKAIADKFYSYSLLIWHHGKIISENYAQGATLESQGQSASMHKSVLAILIGAALNDGLLPSLEVPIGNYIQEWANDARGQITLRQTLEMSTGLKPFSRFSGIFSEKERFVAGLWHESLILDRPTQTLPGSNFVYLNINSQLAGMVLQNAVKQRYAEYLSEKIWKPLGASDAYVWPYLPNGMARTYTSLFARAEDWLRIGIMLKDHGQFEGRQIVPDEWIDAMIKPSPHNPNYGLHIWLASPLLKERWYDDPVPGTGILTGEEWLDPGIFFLDGSGGQRVYVSRAEDLVIVRLGITYGGWDDSALPNAVIRALRATKSVQQLVQVPR